MRKHKQAYLSGLIATFFVCAVSNPSMAAEKWWPLKIHVWDPPFNTESQRREGVYIPLAKAQKPWRVCVSIPHLKDPYWAAVNFGLVDEVKRLGLRLRLVEAGGYGNLDVQRTQITDCMDSGGDVLILSAISADGLNDLIEGYTAKGTPVIDLINGVSSTKVTARAAADYYDNGYAVASYLKKLHPKDDTPVRIAWFPGPEGAGWVARGDRGFRDGIKGTAMKIVTSAYGDTGRATQGGLVEAALNEYPDLDYVVGTTVTANAAIDVIRRRGLSGKTKVLAYYYGPGVHRAIRRGNILAAPTDLQTFQARIAVDMAVRALEGKDLQKHVSPNVLTIDRENIATFNAEASLPPRGFRPIFSFNAW